MNSKTQDVLEKHIEAIVNEFNFLKRQKVDPLSCSCYSSLPCHTSLPIEQLNCLFCLCPHYIHLGSETGCKINSPKGKWFYHESYATGRVWDCSDCDYPHKTENVKKELRKLWGIDKD